MRLGLATCLLLMTVGVAHGDVFQAVETMDAEAVETFLEDGVDPKTRDDEGLTPLHVAARVGHGPIAGLLIRNGAGVNVRAADGRAPLHLAREANQRYMAFYLRTQGADRNALDDAGQTPLDVFALAHRVHWAPNERDLPRARDSARKRPRVATLHVAVALGDVEAIERLLAGGADGRERDADGVTPLHIAAESGYVALVEALGASGRDYDMRDGEGRTPLHLADRDKMIQHLIGCGADTDAVDRRGWTPADTRVQLHTSGHARLYAPWVQPHAAAGARATTLPGAVAISDAERADELIAGGADVTRATANGWTPLHWTVALHADAPAIISTLLGAGADPNARDRTGQTPLHLAGSQLDVARLLLDGGADPNAQNLAGKTLVHSWRASQQMLELFLEHGLDPSLRGETGKTLLHSHGRDRVRAEMLLARGVDPNLLDGEGASAADWLSFTDDRELLDLYFKHGLRGNRALGVLPYSNPDAGIEYLLAHGADRERIGRYLLVRAIRRRDIGTWRKGRSLGARFEDISPHAASVNLGRASLSRAKPSEDLALMVADGLDPNVVDNQHMTPLQRAVWDQSVWLRSRNPRVLLGIGATHDIYTAAGMGEVEIVRQFLDAEVSPDAPHPRDGRTPLHWAARMNHTDVVRLLIERGADVSAVSENGNTPLHEALWYTMERYPTREFVETLVLAGADLTARDEDGETPLGKLRAPWQECWLMFEHGGVM